MKRLFLFLLMILGGIANAQIVNIPDAVFKSKLVNAGTNNPNRMAKNTAGEWMVIDTNNDNEIQLSEAMLVRVLYVSDATITSLEGLGEFSSLQSLEVQCQSLLTLDLTDLNQLASLEISECAALQSLDVSNLLNLASLKIEFSDQLSAINVTGLVNLNHLFLDSVSASIAFSQLLSLETVELRNYNYNVNLSNCPNLRSFILMDGDSGQITLGNKPHLTTLKLQPLTYNSSLDISGCTALTNLVLHCNIDVQAGLTHFFNLKNGVTAYENVSVNFGVWGDSYVYVCTDEGSEGLVTQNNPNIMVSSYCSFTPGGNFNTITGTLAFDPDNSGCGSTGSFAGLAKLNISDGTSTGIVFSNGSGGYGFYTQAGTFTITPEFENNWFTATPPSAIVTLATVDNGTTTQHFCIAPNGIHPDLEVVMAPTLFDGPGFDAVYKIVCRNKGNQTLSGDVVLNYDESILDYVSAIPVASVASAGILTWNFTDLLPFESRHIDVVLNVNGPMEIPAVNIDDILPFSVALSPVTGDETPVDNTFVLNHVVTGSFDPNDITCLEGNSVSPERIGEYLHYNINFENTGTGAASFIVVKNVIDQEKFDASTLQVLEASHDVQIRMTGNKLEFIFDDIDLAPGGKGNVLFKIKTHNTLQVNDDVMQQANIFFDYNWPIETNEAVTVFETLGRGDFDRDNSVKLYPNPAKGILTISAASNIRSIEMYDIQGRLLETGIVNDTTATIDLSARPLGMYFVKVYAERGVKVEKLVKE